MSNVVVGEIFGRTVRINWKNQNDKVANGTGIILDVDDRAHLLTAAHCLPTTDEVPFLIKLATDLSGGFDTEIATIAEATIDRALDVAGLPLGKLKPQFRNPVTSSGGVQYSQQAHFLGYPVVGPWADLSSHRLPLVKNCVFSGMAPPHLILGGFVNPGFSGGPVTATVASENQLLGIVTQMEVEDFEQDEGSWSIEANAGFFRAVDIDWAMKCAGLLG